MGDPGLVAGDLVDIAVTHRAGPQGAEVGAGIGFGEDGGGQDFAASRSAAATSAFCSSVPPQRISSQAISARVPSEPTAIQPRDNSSDTTHMDSFDRPKPAILLRQGQGEDAELGQFLR